MHCQDKKKMRGSTALKCTTSCAISREPGLNSVSKTNETLYWYRKPFRSIVNGSQRTPKGETLCK